MKVLLAADIFPPENGGPATYVVALANELAKQGVEVRIVSLNRGADRSVVSCPMYHVTCNNKLLRYLEYVWLLWREAKHMDVVYAMGPVNAGLPALIAARLRNKKFVVKVVGDYAWEQSMQMSNFQFPISKTIDEFQKIKVGGKIGWLKKVESFVVRQADQVIVPSEYLKRMVVGWGADENKVSVVYNAISVPPITPKLKPAGEQWVVSIGRDVPWKGMKTLESIAETFPNQVKLKIITSASRTEALSVLAAADVFVLNSGYEGLSHVILEAMSLGIPVVASDVGGNPELVREQHLFPYNDAAAIREKILTVLAAPKPAPQPLGDQFQLHTMIHATKKILESVCQH